MNKIHRRSGESRKKLLRTKNFGVVVKKREVNLRTNGGRTGLTICEFQCNFILFYKFPSSSSSSFQYLFSFPFSAFFPSLGRYICFFLLCTLCTLRCSCAAKIKMSYTKKKYSISPAHTHIKCSCSLASVFISHTHTLMHEISYTHIHLHPA